ncbi:MAG: hypothetical protein EOO61_16255 [Hymenobacter sp.]|nr:MAG: hypothetical protein EOO61_16255 [Hymenobacter sp.]
MLTAVLTGDLVASTKLPPSRRSSLLRSWLKETLKTIPFELSQGDSFQFKVATIDGLAVALRLRSHLRSINPLDGYRPDVRISIGLGEIDYTGPSLGESAGPAFELSGRGLLTDKYQIALLRITSSSAGFDAACNTALALAEVIIQRWTLAQALSINAALDGLNQQQIANKRGISQPAVQQQLQAAGWPGLSSLLVYYSASVNLLPSA